MRTPARDQRGITLVELLIVLATLAVLTAGAAPAFGDLLETTQMRAARSDLNLALNHARIAAVSRGANVVVCPSPDRNRCSGLTQWQGGWLVFVDSNGNGTRDPDETVLVYTPARSAGLAIQSTSGRPYVRYRPDGSATGSNLTLTFCDRRGADRAGTLVINNGGRVRSGKPTSDAAAACAATLVR